MTDQEFTKISRDLVSVIQDKTPQDTGNLALNATKSESLGVNKIRVYVDLEIAPYFEYVNNRERLSNGKPNPNRGYFDRAVRFALSKINDRTGLGVRIEKR